LAQIVVLESDLVFAAALSEPLEQRGNRVLAFDDPLLALATLFDRGADLFVLDLEFPAADTRDLIAVLREQKETRSMSILGLSRGLTSKDRLAFFNLGVDEILERGAELEELQLRLRRLLGGRTADNAVLSGHLGGGKLAELLQFVKHSGQSGSLAVSSSSGSGRLELKGGDVATARWENLRGEPALLAVLGLDSGRFHFDSGTVPDGPLMPIQPFLFRAAWIEDELGKRRRFLPGSGIALLPGERQGHPVGLDDDHELPLEPVLAYVRKHGKARLFDLLRADFASPQEVRLAVVLLIEGGYLNPTIDAGAASTRELDVGQTFEIALTHLLERSGHKDLPTALSILLLADQEALEQLTEVFGTVRHPALAELAEQLEERAGGSALLDTQAGRAALHVQVLSAASAPRLQVLLPGCDLLVIWLKGDEQAEVAKNLVARVEGSSRETRGLLIAAGEARPLAEDLVAGTKRFSLAPRPPTTAAGLLRMLAARGRGQERN
jgi:DNA-binding response OmpR family regulator